MSPVHSVDEYIAQAPEELRPRLRDLRATIQAAAPEARERISYGMPYYEYKGRLVYFQLWKKHIGVYALSRTVLEEHRSELEGRVAAKGTVRFSLDEELPLGLIKRLVEAQVREKEA
ncbi:MAG: iron chaperone [Chloroflexia bacterium]